MSLPIGHVVRHGEVRVLADRVDQALEDAALQILFFQDGYHGSVVLHHHALEHDIGVADQADDLAVLDHGGA